jgi:hypothetical protein
MYCTIHTKDHLDKVRVIWKENITSIVNSGVTPDDEPPGTTPLMGADIGGVLSCPFSFLFGT